MYLGRPSRKIAESFSSLHRARKTGGKRGAHIKRLKYGKLLCISFHRIRNFEQKPSTLVRRDTIPCTRFESAARGDNSQINVRAVCFGHARENFLGSWVNHVDGFARLGRDPFPANQQSLGAGLKPSLRLQVSGALLRRR